MSLEFLLPASWSSAAATNYRVSQHAYKNTDRYEQSLDVYHPLLLQEDDNNDKSEKPVIVLVMGSGWMGHIGIYLYFHSTFRWFLSQSIHSTTSHPNDGTFVIPSITTTIQQQQQQRFLFLHGQNAATTIDEMTDDVAAALQYVQENSIELGISNNSKLIIGGYSSGGHLLATYINGIQQNDIDDDSRRRKLNLDRIVGVLYLSAVFSLDNCWFINILTYIVFGRWSWQMPSSSSPMTTISDSYLVTREKQLPHLIIGCQKETFGIPILDHAFATLEYWDKIKQQQYSKSSSKCVLVPSNHWCILSSTALTDALETNIPQVFFVNSQTTKEEEHAGEKNNDDTTTPTPELRRQAEVLSSEAYTNSMNSVTTTTTSANADADASADSPVPSLTNDDSDDNDNDDDMITPGSSSSFDNRDGTTTTTTPELHRQAEVLSSGSSLRSLTSTSTTNNKNNNKNNSSNSNSSSRKNSPTPELRRQQEVLSSFNSATSVTTNE
eukprot:scaffold6484_cov78-Cylindrotheca_fusiformis.AAC.1